jgi:peptide-methionine (S)-S-oxide reductase
MNASHYRIRIAAIAAASLTGALLMASMHNGASQAADPTASTTSEDATDKSAADVKKEEAPKDKYERATFGSGCFWCSEAAFSQLKGVKSAISGFSGGRVKNPTYKQVSTGHTGHAEVVQVTYDPKVITYPELLEVFWEIHDPTTLNRQGADVGTQYRSVIFYHNEEQQKEAEHYKKKLNESHAFKKPIVTQIAKFEKFYSAEDYHQEYFAQNPDAAYCQMVIRPKIEEFRQVFANKLKGPNERQAESVEK